MRRIARCAFTAIVALSLLLCVASCALWARSYFVGDSLLYQYPRDINGTTCWDMHHVMLGRGSFVYNFLFQYDLDLRTAIFYGEDSPHGRRADWSRFQHRRGEPVEPDPNFSRTDDPKWGFKYVHFVNPQPGLPPHGAGYLLIFPMWLPTVAFAALPAVRFVQRTRRRRRTQLGLCRACGYDLRASPERCPECGAIANT